ncbi:TonB-dependent receptor [Ramlibacter tataouinensis]|uniref:TonB-dependent receptor n=1 Tax=Ramlibacter tataouinensis TaxID=94132 RepID=UPI00131402BD|nr:TonB-dependent receptor [Ramlibacter tataouinensis]
MPAQPAPADQAGSSPTSAGAQTPKAPVSLGTVEVTASKRKERLQDTPQAISVLGGEQIERLGIEKFTDYMSLVPNLTQAAGASPGFGTVIMRGLYTGPQQLTNTSATYVGDSPFSASGSLSVGALLTPDPDLVDVARIEVLKGPQGTLWGASSLGGMIRIIPREPDLTGVSGSVRVSGSKVQDGGTGYGVRASLNLPASDSLGFLVSAFNRKDAGASRNVKTGHDDLGWSEGQGGSLSALGQISRDWKVNFRVLNQQLKSLGGTGQDNVQGTDRPLFGERTVSAATDGPNKVNYGLVELGTEYVSPYGTLNATFSQAENRGQLQADYTNPYGPFVAAFLPPGFSIIGDLDINLKKKQTGEVRFATNRFGGFEGLLGAFYTDERTDYLTKLTSFLSNGAVAPAPIGNFLTSDTQSTYKEGAVFANGTYYFTDAVDIGAGLRYATNKQNATLSSTGLIGRNTPPNFVDFEDSSTTYQVTARWRPNSDLTTFARYATGYRPGGPQTNPNPPTGTPTTFKADTVGNFELGVKGLALDRRLRFDASVYHIDWKDVQLNGLFNGLLLVANAGRAKVDGAEAQLMYQPSAAMQLGANLGYNNARLTEVGTSTAAFLGAAPGDRLPGSPKLTAALFADWYFPVGNDMRASLGATLRYQGDKVSSYSNSVLNPSFKMPAYALLDLRAGLEWSRYSLRLHLDNATDKLGYTSYTTNKVAAAQTSLPSNATVTTPRTVSLVFGADF